MGRIRQIISKHSTFILIIFIVSIYIFSLRGFPGNLHPNSKNVGNSPPFETSLERGRYAQTIALAENRSFNVDGFINFLKPDLAWYNGHYYPAFPPGISVISVPFYLVGKYFGLSQVITFLVSPVFSILTVITIIKAAQTMKLSRGAGVLSAFVFVVSFALAYSTTLSAHIVSAFIITLCFLISLLIEKGKNNLWKLGLLWFIYSLNLFVDYPNLFILLPIVIASTVKVIKIEKSESNFKINVPLGFFIAPFAVLPIFLLFASYNILHYQKPVTFTNRYNLRVLEIQGIKYDKLSNELFSRKSYSSRFNLARVYNGVDTLLISSDRGLVTYAPIFIISIIGFLIAAVKRQKWWEFILLTFIFNLIVYAAFDDPWGGWGFGPRYLIPSLPLLALLVGRGFDYLMKYGIKAKIIIIALLSYTSTISILGALTTNAVPPSSEAGALGTYDNFLLNWKYLISNGTSSFFYYTFLQNLLSPLEYFIGIFLFAILFSILFISFIRSKAIN